MKKFAIIVAGGSGQRMLSAVPKQFLLLQGKPVLYHTISAFYSADPQTEIILVLPRDQFDYWNSLISELPIIAHRLVEGGNSRFHSSQNAIQTINEDGLVAIHDGVRPLIDPELITKGFRSAVEKGNAVLAVASKDSVRMLSADNIGSEHLNRESIRLIQTPQIFTASILHKAYQQAYRNEFSDDAAVVERLGIPIHILIGETQNIKITYPEDILLAENILKHS